VLHLYSADRAEPLARKLAEVLIDDPGDPMDAEWLAVPSDGMRRWLVLELARHLGATTGPSSDGVAANIIRAYPATLRSAVLDADSGGRPDPWHIDRMVWPLSALFDRLEREGTLPAFTRLPDGGSRFTRVRLVADLVDRYHLHRPEMVRRWVQGDLVDGNLEPINGHASWQPELWRMLRAAIQVESPPERMPRILADLREDRLAVELPDACCSSGSRRSRAAVSSIWWRRSAVTATCTSSCWSPITSLRACCGGSGRRPAIQAVVR